MSNIIHTNEQANYLSDAFLAKEAYKTLNRGDIVTDSFGTRWEVMDRNLGTNASDYQGYIFKNLTTQQYKAAHRGTDSLKDVPATVKIGLDMLPSGQLDVAVDWINEFAKSEKVDASQIDQVGHSLGGAMAKLVAVVTGSKAVSINGHGVGHLLNDLEREYPDDFTNGQLTSQDFSNTIINLNATGDVYGCN